jgi:hypothetical protein
VSAPPHSGGSPTRSLSQPSTTVSVASANRDDARTNAFWSSSETVQSAANAAGVEPPMTKWKNRGPADAVAVTTPTRNSFSTAGSVPTPSSGSAPPSSPSCDSLELSQTRRSESASRYGPAASKTCCSTARVASCSRSGSPMAFAPILCPMPFGNASVTRGRPRLPMKRLHTRAASTSPVLPLDGRVPSTSGWAAACGHARLRRSRRRRALAILRWRRASSRAVDLPEPHRTPVAARRSRRAHRTARSGQRLVGLPADPGRAAQARPPGRRVHDPPDPQESPDPAGTDTPQQPKLAAVPARADLRFAQADIAS